MCVMVVGGGYPLKGGTQSGLLKSVEVGWPVFGGGWAGDVFALCINSMHANLNTWVRDLGRWVLGGPDMFASVSLHACNFEYD